MEKFSIYDLIGLLLPGYVFVFFCQLLNGTFIDYPLFIFQPDNEIWTILVLSLIFGSMFFALNFFLVKKVKWYRNTFGIYKHVADLYISMHNLHAIMNDVFNEKAKHWFKTKVFFDSDDYQKFDTDEKKRIKNLQDSFYDRMYYELEYLDKLENARTVQSFYYFFRQLASVFIVLILFTIALFLLSFVILKGFNNPEFSSVFWLITLFLLNLIISVILARWFRKRMVMKMYWAYFSHLNLTSNK